MLNRRQDSVYAGMAWPAMLALLFSLLLHALLFGFAHLDFDPFKHQADRIQVRLVSTQTELPVAPVAEPVPDPEPEPQIEPQQAKEEPGPDSPPLIDVPVELPEPHVEAPDSPETIPLESFTQGDAETHVDEAEVVEESDVSEDAGAPDFFDSPETDVIPYRFVESEYDILRGVDGYKVGQTKVRYEVRDDGTYLLESRSEAKGFASWFISGALLQRSEGLLTWHGLKPLSFLYRYGAKNRTRQATFDWDGGQIILQTDKDSRTSLLPSDAQDLMSFMYQFMYVPPLREMQLSITNGKRLKTYNYSFVGEEDLSTKMGSMRALHIENVNDDGDEKTELWLALEYNFLPVKIRKTEEDGSVIEQIITRITTELVQ